MSNLAQYISDVRLYVGDIGATQFLDATVLLALENAVAYLSIRWQSKYLLYSSGIVNTASAPIGFINVNTPQGMCTIESGLSEGDVFRNCNFTFSSVSPPIIEQKDLPAVLIAATYLLFRSISWSSSSGLSWSTPDLSFNNNESSRMLRDFIQQQLDALDLFFKQKLGKIQIGNFPHAVEFLQNNTAVEIANFYSQQVLLQKFK